uniref:Fe2OG dioxygenase domain-containing protein n=1 Tax=viral metagenome TaxID=1070528 RepID=A0A6C0LTK8_9ZZZZ
MSVVKNLSGIKGLWYIKDYLTDSEINMIKEKINNEIEFESITNSHNSRRTAHFGYYYLYDRSGLKNAPIIPDFLKDLVNPKRINNKITKYVVSDTCTFNQIIINEYTPGQQIAYHIDHVKLFGPIIVCITIGQSIPIKFKYDDNIKEVNIDEGSMYIMTDAARYKWQHSLKNISDNTRYSLTYRVVNSKE